ncbi:MAG TPA: sugar ABC transporter permease [Kineosporiaceae bacterium]|nr:sugar ABC transporter permease [Kineosporiaceae bacterium]
MSVTPAQAYRSRWGYLFVAPAAVLLLTFLVAPLCYAVAISFTNRVAVPTPRLPTQFVGLDNYRELVADPDFRTAILHNLLFTIIVVPLQTGLALGLALLVNLRLRGHALFRTAYFIPIAVPLSVAGLIWKLILDENQGRPGILTEVLSTLTAGAVTPHWLADTHWTQVAVVLVSLWSSVGFQMVILLAALQAVPRELHEAAMLDGAGAWRRLWAVTIPGIRPQLFFVTTTTAVLSFRLFDQVYVLPTSPGGPQGATTTLMLYIVRLSQENGPASRVGLAAAATVIFLVIVLLVSLLQRRLEPKD